MVKRVFIFCLFFLVFLSCAEVDQGDYHAGLDVLQLSVDNQNSFELVNMDHHISLERANTVLRSVYPEKKVLSVQPVRIDEDEIMYVTNFEKGWALLAADDRVESLVLAYSDDGSFDPDRPANPGIKVWFEIQKDLLYHLSLLKDEKKVPLRTKSTSYEPYYWLGYHIGTENYSSHESVDHILTTKWGQGIPWNEKLPDQSYPTGCLAVATSQILYHLQTQKGFSIGLYHTVIPTYSDSGTSNDYVISNMQYGDYHEPSSRWAAMPVNYSGPNTSYVADLMVDIGYRFGFTYSPSGTGCPYVAPVFDTYSIDSDSGAFYFSLVKANLDYGFPVMVVAYQYPEYLNGHAWVIDGYTLAESVADKSYRWRIAPSDSLAYYSGYEFCYTEAEKQLYAPDADEEEIYHIIERTGGNYLRMNWGYDGSGDNGYYYMADYHWPTGYNNQYRYHPWITYNYRQHVYEEDD